MLAGQIAVDVVEPSIWALPQVERGRPAELSAQRPAFGVQERAIDERASAALLVGAAGRQRSLAAMKNAVAVLDFRPAPRRGELRDHILPVELPADGRHHRAVEGHIVTGLVIRAGWGRPSKRHLAPLRAGRRLERARVAGLHLEHVGLIPIDLEIVKAAQVVIVLTRAPGPADL